MSSSRKSHDGIPAAWLDTPESSRFTGLGEHCLSELRQMGPDCINTASLLRLPGILYWQTRGELMQGGVYSQEFVSGNLFTQSGIALILHADAMFSSEIEHALNWDDRMLPYGWIDLNLVAAFLQHR